jgi:adenylate cyclase
MGAPGRHIVRGVGDADEGKRLLEETGRKLWARVPFAHLAGAVLAATSGALTGRIRHQHGFGPTDAITLAVYLAIALPVASMWSKRELHRSVTWLLEGREPAESEQRRTLAEPWHLAAQGMAFWVGAAAIWTAISIQSHSAGYAARVALSILLGGLTTSGVTYLLVEWTMRPIAQRALEGNVPERNLAPGIGLRLLLAWAIGADVFLLMIGLTYVGRPANQPPSAAAIWFIIGAGFAAGSVVLYVAARSLVTPLLELRRSVARVKRGDLEVEVEVYDGGEIGMLQAGFNEMVAGLRERRTLQDLFGRHVGTEVARQALEQGVDLVGERREVGVVFVDLIGSTALALSRSPEDVLTLLNRFFATIVKVVAAEGGWVNKFEGDGALCVFGAPIARGDYAVRALRAARTLRRELLALTAAVPALDAAIGVSAGGVVAGNVGAEQRYEYTVIGAPVNEAARLTDEAKGRLGRVLASEEAVSRSGGESASWLVADELTLRGHSQPTLVYEPTERLEAKQPAEAERL